MPDEGTPHAPDPVEDHVDLDEDGRRYPSTIGGLCYLGILTMAIVGVVVAAFGEWRWGVYLIAGALSIAAVLRAVLPQRDAGMLAVRSRVLDACLLAGVGIALFALASGLPSGP